MNLDDYYNQVTRVRRAETAMKKAVCEHCQVIHAVEDTTACDAWRRTLKAVSVRAAAMCGGQ